MHLSELMHMTRDLVSLFDEQVGSWSVPVRLTEPMAEVGQLSDHLFDQHLLEEQEGT